MSNNSSIEWTNMTWNPLAGCTRVSPGCDACYAAPMAMRLDAMAQADIRSGKKPGGKAKYIGVATRVGTGKAAFNGKINLDYVALHEPCSWGGAKKVFVNSMSDLFHKAVPDDFIDQVFAVMASCQQHTFQILTKRADRMAEYMRNPDRLENIYAQWYSVNSQTPAAEAWPLPNVWLGTSVENQEAADLRIPALRMIPAKVRFLSVEPMLGPVQLDLDGINWVICGGESGHGARPMQPDWARSLRDQCQAANVPFFFKQWGGMLPESQMTDEQYEMVAERDPESFGGVRRFKRASTLAGGELFFKIGKEAAGHTLDGVEYRQFPV